MRELFKDKKYCAEQLMIAIEKYGNKTTTKAEYDAMEKTLCFMYLYCPEEIKTNVYAILSTATWRRKYFETVFWSEQNLG